MLPINQATKSRRALLLSRLLFNDTTIYSPSSPPPLLLRCSSYSTATTVACILPMQQHHHHLSFNPKQVVQSFKDWFKSRNNTFFDQIFHILSAQDEVDDNALSHLHLPLSESLVLDLLYYGNHTKNDVLSCLKFFDWAGRQRGFSHTRATFHAIFKILSKAKLMTLMLDFLDKYMRLKFLNHKIGCGFYNTLVMGYAVAGKPLFALQLFGRMRFQGIDLDSFTYHVLLNALIEECCFDAVEDIARQIKIRGFVSHTTHCILVKSFCKQKMFGDAESYLRRVVEMGDGSGHGDAVGIVINALCKNGQFDEGGQLVEEFMELGVVPMDNVYGVWIRNLVQAGKVDRALEFLQHKKSSECYVPEVSRWNVLLCRLLKENRLRDVCDLMMEMMEGGILPDKVTMNGALCFFCKTGMVDVALELYSCKSEFGLSPSNMACNYLINSLCGEGSIDEAYHVLKNSAEQGYFPGRRTFSILADALYREGKVDMMKELVFVALNRNFMPSVSIYDKFISALCRARRLEDGYLIHQELNRMNGVAAKKTYTNLIHGFNKLNKGDIAARLLIEMQDKGHMASRTLFRAVIRSLCDMENPEIQFLKLLEMQLSCHESNCQIYNFFIDGAGHAKKPELARNVFEMMRRSEIEPNLSTDILMLQSYLKSGRISDALNFFDALRQRRKIGRKLYNTMVVGLCKVNQAVLALHFLDEMRSKDVVPSVECYEVLIQLLCSNKRYDMAIDLVYDLLKAGRYITSFIGNIFLLHSLQTGEIYDAWVRVKKVQNETSSDLSALGYLIALFSDDARMSQQIENLEEMIELCFPLDLYTYNMLLRRLSMSKMDDAYKLFDRLCQKGYEPNRWTYDILVHGLYKHGRIVEARRWVEEMFRKGFDLTDCTKETHVVGNTNLLKYSLFYKILEDKK